VSYYILIKYELTFVKMLVLAMQFSSNNRKAKAPDPNPTGPSPGANSTFKAKETMTGARPFVV